MGYPVVVTNENRDNIIFSLAKGDASKALSLDKLNNEELTALISNSQALYAPSAVVNKNFFAGNIANTNFNSMDGLQIERSSGEESATDFATLDTEQTTEAFSFSSFIRWLQANKDTGKKTEDKATTLINELNSKYDFDEKNIQSIEQLDNGNVKVVFKKSDGKQYTYTINSDKGVVMVNCLQGNDKITVVNNGDGTRTFAFNNDSITVLSNNVFNADSDMDIKAFRNLIDKYNNYVNTSAPMKSAKPVSPDLPDKYSLENLRKMYPESDYSIELRKDYSYEEDYGVYDIICKKTGKPVLRVWPYSVDKYAENGSITRERYDKGHLYEVEITGVPDDNGTCTNEFYEYDSEGNVTTYRKEIYKDDKTLESVEIQYNKDGSVKSEVKKYSHSYLADKIAEDIYAKNSVGLPTTGEKIGEHISAITGGNVLAVLDAYSKSATNTDKEDLITAIVNERGLPIKERVKYIKHIVKCLSEIATKKGIDVSYIEKDIENILEQESKSWGPASAGKISYQVTRLIKICKANGSSDSDKANGKIDNDFEQNREGDCWLIATIKALADSPKGLEILNDSIKVDEKGGVTVTLKGVGETYYFSKEELDARSDLSIGDRDVRALEMAVERYIVEHPDFEEDRTDLCGDTPLFAMKLLTGKDITVLYDISNTDIEKFNNPDCVAVVSISREKDGVTCETPNGKVTLHGSHSYTVKGSDDKYVYLINPWDTSKTIAVPIDVFKDVFSRITVCEL